MPLKVVVNTIDNGIAVNGNVNMNSMSVNSSGAQVKRIAVSGSADVRTRIAIGEGGGGCDCEHLPYEDACEILEPWTIEGTNLLVNASTLVQNGTLVLGRYSNINETDMTVEDNEYER